MILGNKHCLLDEYPGIGDQGYESQGSDIGDKVDKNGRLISRNDRRGIAVQRHGVSVTEHSMQSLLMSFWWEVIVLT